MLVGVTYELPLGSWLDLRPSAVDCVEVRADDFRQSGPGRLGALRERYEVLVRTDVASLGSRTPIDAAPLATLATLVRAARPRWVSAIAGFRRTADFDLGVPCPVPLDEARLAAFASQVEAIMRACGVPVLVENLCTPMSVQGDEAEPALLSALAARTGCGLLLDLASLMVNARNRRFDPMAWLSALDLTRVAQVRVGGVSFADGIWFDGRDRRVDDESLRLLSTVSRRASLQAVVLDRAGRFPPVEEIEADLARIRATLSS